MDSEKVPSRRTEQYFSNVDVKSRLAQFLPRWGSSATTFPPNAYTSRQTGTSDVAYAEGMEGVRRGSYWPILAPPFVRVCVRYRRSCCRAGSMVGEARYHPQNACGFGDVLPDDVPGEFRRRGLARGYCRLNPRRCAAHPAHALYDELDQLNDYTTQYHHGENVSDTRPIRSIRPN